VAKSSKEREEYILTRGKDTEVAYSATRKVQLEYEGWTLAPQPVAERPKTEKPDTK
jgi:hypothetical protein